VKECHGSGGKPFPATAWAFCSIQTIVRYETTPDSCECIFDSYLCRSCHSNRVTVVIIAFSMGQFHGSGWMVEYYMTV